MRIECKQVDISKIDWGKMAREQEKRVQKMIAEDPSNPQMRPRSDRGAIFC